MCFPPLGLISPRPVTSSKMLRGTVAAICLLFEGQPSTADEKSPEPPGRRQTGDSFEAWGPPSQGIRCRLLAVPASTDDESPDLSKTTHDFACGDDVTFAVELKNVGEKTVTLLGTRYGDSYPTAQRKLATAHFAPRLFEFEFTNAEGVPLPRPSRSFIQPFVSMTGASTHDLEPGASLVILLRPEKFNPPMNHVLPPGRIRARVRYSGPNLDVLRQSKKHWPDKPAASAWPGKAVSNEVAFTVADDPSRKKAQLVWGEANNGLRCAVEFRRRAGSVPHPDPAGVFPFNTILEDVVHVQNVGDKPVKLVSESWRQEDSLTVVDEGGHQHEVQGTRYSGWPVMVRWELLPGETAELRAAGIGIAADKDAVKQFDEPVGKKYVAKPGKHTFRYTVRLGSIQSKDADGNAVFPTKDDWTGELVAGDTMLAIRERTPADNAREHSDWFVGRIAFVSREGKLVESGTFTARLASKGQDLTKGEIRPGSIEIPDCPPKPLTISVRAPGYEELFLRDVQLKSNETKRIELTPAVPTRMRLVSAIDGRPVAGAKVRFFNKQSEGAGSGPIPADGIQGPIWTTSAAGGTVVLDSLQRTDPDYPKFGDAVYFFYIESPDLAPRFVGPVKAGEDVGDVSIGPTLEVRGEVHGTPEELARFAAEWDQPFDHYAVSARLKTKGAGDKLTFHLTGLRPGKLRIISNFGPRPHSVSHTYGRRDPLGTDVVTEVELTESLTGLIVAPARRQPATVDD